MAAFLNARSARTEKEQIAPIPKRLASRRTRAILRDDPPGLVDRTVFLEGRSRALPMAMVAVRFLESAFHADPALSKPQAWGRILESPHWR